MRAGVISKVSKLIFQKNYNKQEKFFGESSPHQKVDFTDNYSLLASFVPLSAFVEINHTDFFPQQKLHLNFACNN
jgi:hypothetical protein